jgi:hypothetical protein
MLPVAIVAAALLAMLVVVPLASAAPNPIASGTTTLTIDNGPLKSAKEADIKITPPENAAQPGQAGTQLDCRPDDRQGHRQPGDPVHGRRRDGDDPAGRRRSHIKSGEAPGSFNFTAIGE